MSKPRLTLAYADKGICQINIEIHVSVTNPSVAFAWHQKIWFSASKNARYRQSAPEEETVKAWSVGSPACYKNGNGSDTADVLKCHCGCVCSRETKPHFSVSTSCFLFVFVFFIWFEFSEGLYEQGRSDVSVRCVSFPLRPPILSMHTLELP